MSDTSYPSALPSTGTPSQCIISESFNDWNAILCPCCIYGQGGSPHCQPGSRWSSFKIPQHHLLSTCPGINYLRLDSPWSKFWDENWLAEVSKGSQLWGNGRKQKTKEETELQSIPSKASADLSGSSESIMVLLSCPKFREGTWHSHATSASHRVQAALGRSLGWPWTDWLSSAEINVRKSSVLKRGSGWCRKGSMTITGFLELRGTLMGTAFRKRKCLDKNNPPAVVWLFSSPTISLVQM